MRISRWFLLFLSLVLASVVYGSSFQILPSAFLNPTVATFDVAGNEPYTESGATFTSGGFAWFLRSEDGKLYILFPPDTFSLLVSFSTPQNSIGFDVIKWGSGDPVSLLGVTFYTDADFASASDFYVPAADIELGTSDSAEFFGVQATQSFQSVEIQFDAQTSAGIYIDDFRFEPVPEPSSWVLVSGGLFLGCFVRRFLRNTSLS